jgi:DNA-binding MarR family transcriptional regulator
MAGRDADARVVAHWRDIRAAHARTVCELDRELHQHGLGASDFEVLDVLVEGGPGMDADGCSLRVQELADRVHLSQSALSRLVARLERNGLVSRGMCSEDRRGVRVAITDAGRRRHAEVRPLQREVLGRMLEIR